MAPAWPSQAVRPEQDRRGTIRVLSEEVLVDVVVTDGGGKPVTNLRADDFRIFEDGVPQQIRAFRLESMEAETAGSPARTSPDRLMSAPTIEPPAIPPRPRLISLVFDTTGTPREGALMARQAARDYVGHFMGPDDFVAVFGTGLGMHIFQPYTQDRTGLREAIDQVTSGDLERFGSITSEIRMQLQTVIGSGWSDAEKIASAWEELAIQPSAAAVQREERAFDPEGAGRPENVNSLAYASLRTLLVFQHYEREFQGRMSFSGLMSVIEAQRIFPGRKALVFFSGGFAVTPASAPQFRSVASAANRANVTIYAVDTAGLRPDDPSAASNLQIGSVIAARVRGLSADRVVGGQSLLDRIEEAARLNPLGNLEELSSETGGYTIKNTNDLQAGLRRIAEDLRAYYVLAYTPANTNYDGRFRSISVRVKRPGLKVRARAGYHAFQSRDNMPLLAFELPLLEALNTRKEADDFPLAVAGYDFRRNDSSAVTLLVEFPMAALTLRSDREEQVYRAELDTMVLVKDSGGAVLRKFSREYRLEGPLNESGAARKRSAAFARHVTLRPGQYVVESAVRDRPSGRIAVSRTPLDVRPQDGSAIRISSIVLGKSATPGSDGIAAEEENPFLVQGAAIMPDMSATYRKSSGDVLVAYFNVYTEPRVSSPLTAGLEFLLNGSPVMRAEGSLPDPDSTGRVQYVTSFGLHDFRPGEYAVRVTVGDGSSSATRSSSFSVVP